MKKYLCLSLCLFSTTLLARDVVCRGESTDGLRVEITLDCTDDLTQVNRLTTQVDDQIVSSFENPQVVTSPYDDESDAFVVIGQNEDESFQTALGVDFLSPTLAVVFTPDLALMVPSVQCQ